MIIKGKKIILRKKRLSDATNDYCWRTDEELAKLDATKPLKVTFSEYLRYYQDELQYKTTWAQHFAIETLDNKHIGNCMYYDIDSKLSQAELGILIGNRSYWGAGYGEDTVITLLKHIYSQTNLTRIFLHTLEWNKRAIRCFEKSGLERVAHVERSNATFAVMECYKDSWLKFITIPTRISDNNSG